MLVYLRLCSAVISFLGCCFVRLPFKSSKYKRERLLSSPSLRHPIRSNNPFLSFFFRVTHSIQFFPVSFVFYSFLFTFFVYFAPTFHLFSPSLKKFVLLNLLILCKFSYFFFLIVFIFIYFVHGIHVTPLSFVM